MTDRLTELDNAHQAMEAGDAPERLRYFGVLADTEVIVWLEAEASEGDIRPLTRELDGGTYVLAFDTDARLAELVADPVPTLRLPGRALAHALAGQGIGIALNIGGAPSSNLLPPDVIDWMVEALAGEDESRDEQPKALAMPKEVPLALGDALGARLAPVAGETAGIWLSEATYAGGRQGLLLVVVGAPDARQPAIRDAVREAVVFTGAEEGALSVLFLPREAELARRLPANAMLLDVDTRLDQSLQPTPPGTDPRKPPRLH